MVVENRKYRRQRAWLVEDLRAKQITDEAVLKAIGNVPRHLFMDTAMRYRAYTDQALPIGMNQTISQPYTVAYQSMLLAARPGERILEIGTGSGYQAAVLAEMGATVYSIERHALLQDRARIILDQLDYPVFFYCGDGTLGWPTHAPFDGIVVTAGAADVPPALLSQLRLPAAGEARGGRLVIPVGNQETQVMRRIFRTGQDAYETETFDGFRFVPLIGRGGGAMPAESV